MSGVKHPSWNSPQQMQLPDQRPGWSLFHPQGLRMDGEAGKVCTWGPAARALRGRRCSSPTAAPVSHLHPPGAWERPTPGEAPPATRLPMAFLSLHPRLLSALVLPISQPQPLFLNAFLHTYQASRPLLPDHLLGQPLPHSLSFLCGSPPTCPGGALSSQALSLAPMAFILTRRPETQLLSVDGRSGAAPTTE